MVHEFQSTVRVHKHTFEMVMAAYERRFPSCSQIPVVVDCAIVDDHWAADDSARTTTRRCQLNVDAPYLLKKMVGVDYIYFIQKNFLDLKARSLSIEATNETFASKVSVVEKCRYYVHPENPEWTCFEQSAELDIRNFLGLESTIEKIAIKQYAANCAKGRELVDIFMAEVNADGVTSLPPWTAGAVAANRRLRSVLSYGAPPASPTPPASRRVSQTLQADVHASKTSISSDDFRREMDSISKVQDIIKTSISVKSVDSKWLKKSKTNLSESEGEASGTVLMKPNKKQRLKAKYSSHGSLFMRGGYSHDVEGCSRCPGCMGGYDTPSCESVECRRAGGRRKWRRSESCSRRGCYGYTTALGAVVLVLAFLLALSLSFIFWHVIQGN